MFPCNSVVPFIIWESKFHMNTLHYFAFLMITSWESDVIVCSPEDVDEVATDVSIVDSSYAIGLILYMLDNRYRDFSWR